MHAGDQDRRRIAFTARNRSWVNVRETVEDGPLGCSSGELLLVALGNCRLAALLELVESGIPAWQHPGTDYSVSFPPFNSRPTQYRISIDGHQRWFAQRAFESLAARWHFPGKTVRIDAPCLDCGEPIAIEMHDEEILSVEPEGVVGYAYGQIGGPPGDRPFR